MTDTSTPTAAQQLTRVQVNNLTEAKDHATAEHQHAAAVRELAGIESEAASYRQRRDRTHDNHDQAVYAARLTNLERAIVQKRADVGRFASAAAAARKRAAAAAAKIIAEARKRDQDAHLAAIEAERRQLADRHRAEGVAR